MASSVGTEYEDIWEIVREQVDISREEFEKVRKELMEELMNAKDDRGEL